MDKKQATILVGHGVPASDTPRSLVTEFKTLEGRRRALKGPIGDREAELDKTLREWPRTRETDPYQWGLQQLADHLRSLLDGRRLEIAYNEFCSPSLQETIRKLVSDAYLDIILVPTMYTPGGLHSEIEIPEIVASERARHPGLRLTYAWPFDLDHVAQFLYHHIHRAIETRSG